MSLLRDTALGQAIRGLAGRQWLPFPEEEPAFEFRPAKGSEDVSEDRHLVDWYGPKDPENPRNWSARRKIWVTALVTVYSFIVYCGSSIIVPSYQFLMLRYNVSKEVVSLALSVYIIGYGMGPMLFSPLSEIPAIGRNPPYVVSFTVFVVVSVILAVLDSFPAILVLRFLQGFFGSPCLASGGASIQDIFSWSTAPYGFVFWVGGFYCGPALGPLLAGYAVSTNWRWPLWETVIIAAPFLIVLVVLLPETSHETLLLRRAQRLRRRTGNPALRAVSETKTLDFRAILVDALVKPTEIAIKDPAIAFVCVYSSFVYAIYYSFFEAFPITYGETYTMSLPSVCLVFLCIIVGCVGAGVLYCGYLYYIFLPRSTRQLPSQESRLIPALPAVCFLPAGLFLYAWTARSSIHWLVPTLGVTVYAGASFVVFQAIICYVPLSYPQYVASLFAANDFMRSMAAAGFVMFSRAMYVNLGVAKGVTVLGGLSIMGILGMFFLYVYGGRLRERSRFAAA